ncbi:MAG: hypothetical protein AB8G96_15915 [Phycisphaerales bacterium]
MNHARPIGRLAGAIPAFLMTLVLLVSLGGCARPWTTAGAAELPAHQQAVVDLPDSLIPGSLRLDGRSAPHRDVSTITLAPGLHTLTWRYLHRNRHVESLRMPLDLAPGDHVRLRQRFLAADGPLGPVGDVAGFTVETVFLPLRWLFPAGEEPPPGRMHAWVEDRATGDVLAGRPPDLPTGYVELTIVPID